MTPTSAFLVQHLIFVFFLYGLAFFAMGLALLLARRRHGLFPLALALGPLATFALLHGAHEWYAMFQLGDGQSHYRLTTLSVTIGWIENASRSLKLDLLINRFVLHCG